VLTHRPRFGSILRRSRSKPSITAPLPPSEECKIKPYNEPLPRVYYKRFQKSKRTCVRAHQVAAIQTPNPPAWVGLATLSISAFAVEWKVGLWRERVLHHWANCAKIKQTEQGIPRTLCEGASPRCVDHPRRIRTLHCRPLWSCARAGVCF
jgi:hypothetical protein